MKQCLLGDIVAPTVLQLMQAALCTSASSSSSSFAKDSKAPSKTRGSSEESNEGDRTRSSRSSSSSSSSSESAAAVALVAQLYRYLDKPRLASFVRTFLLENNSTSVRWQAHGLVLAPDPSSFCIISCRL